MTITTEHLLYLILVFVIPVGVVSYYSLFRRFYRFIHRRVLIRRAAKKRELMRAERIARRARKNKKGKP